MGRSGPVIDTQIGNTVSHERFPCIEERESPFHSLDREKPMSQDLINNTARYPDASLTKLLFLYFWPTTLFEDASTGSREEQWAKYRRNREKRTYLPHYGKVWSFFSLIFLMLGLAVSKSFPAHLAAQIAATAILTAFTCSLANAALRRCRRNHGPAQTGASARAMHVSASANAAAPSCRR